MRKILSFFLLALIYPDLLFSQDFLIRHDLVADKTTYYRVNRPTDTTVVENVILKRQGKLTLNVDNYNPYYWQAKVTAVKVPDDEESANAGLFNPFSVKGLGGLLKSVMPDLDLAAIAGGRSSPSVANEENEDGYLYWAAAYLDAYTRYRNMVQLGAELKILKLRLEELKFDIVKTAPVIKTTARDAVQAVLQTDQLDFENILKLGRSMGSEYMNLSDSLEIIMARINRLVPKVDPKYFFDGTTIGEVNHRIHTADSIYGLMNRDPDFLQLLADVGKVYKDIQSSSYKYSYTINAADNYEQLRLQLYSRQDTLATDTLTRYFPIQSRGHMRLRNSVGLAFTYFSDKNRNYYVLPDTTIGNGKADYFTPIVCTYIHFYGYKTGGFKLGGAVGFGLPVNGTQLDINYMMGICGVIGKNEPILISLGVAGAKVERLAKGWLVGSKVPEPGFDIPTVKVFRAGAFLSITFNLGRMSVTKKDE